MDRTDFLAAVAASGVLTPARLATAAAALPPGVATAPHAAQCLIAAGALTRFQADRLLAGRADGFVIDPYVIQEQVGRGSVGRVYKALHRTMHRAVAIKILAADLTRTPAARDGFRQAARAAARLDHPNIVTTYDAHEVAGRSYLVMEFVDGPTLAALVKDRGPLPVAEACELVRQAAAGLAAAHALGVPHGDLKPTNLLVARASKTLPGCVVKITDFGIDRLAPPPAADRTPAPGPVGTADFLAPECSTDPAAGDPRADLYALGCVFYFLLTGRPPFAGGTADAKAARHRGETPAPVGRVRPDVPPAVAAAVARLLAKDPAARFPTAAALADHLRPWAAGAAVSAEDGGIDFDLPAVRPGPYTSTSGYLTALSPALAPAAATDTADASPWAQLTDAAGGAHTVVVPRDPKPAGRTPPARGIVAALGSVVRALAR